MTHRIAMSMLLVMGCHARGTDPHAMGAGEHEAHAQHETELARQHDAQAHEATGGSCDRARFGPCWTTSEEHAHASERHRELAARHRAASTVLRQAESNSCVGIADDDRETSPFSHRADIRSVEAIEESFPKGNDRVTSRLAGARITFRAVPGMTAQWLQRDVDCHLARNAAIGHASASEDMPDCPLTLAGVHATASSTADGVVVAITSEDPAIAAEILRRAQKLVATESPRGRSDGTN